MERAAALGSAAAARAALGYPAAPPFKPTPEELRAAGAFCERHPELGNHGWDRPNVEPLDVEKVAAVVEFVRRMDCVPRGQYILRRSRVRTLRNLFRAEHIISMLPMSPACMACVQACGGEGVGAESIAAAILTAMGRRGCFCGDGYVAAALLHLGLADEARLRGSEFLHSTVVGPPPAVKQRWSERFVDMEWVVKVPHKAFAGRKLSAKSTPNLDITGSIQWKSLADAELAGLQPSFVQLHGEAVEDEGHPGHVLLRDTARILIPHSHCSRVSSELHHETMFVLGRGVQGRVHLRVTEPGVREIRTEDLLALLLPGLRDGSPFDARWGLRAPQGPDDGWSGPTPHDAASFFYSDVRHDPKMLFLVLLGEYDTRPPASHAEATRRNQIWDFWNGAPVAILFDDGGEGPGKIFVNEEVIGPLAVKFITKAFAESGIYRRYCDLMCKRIRVENVWVLDASDSEETLEHED